MTSIKGLEDLLVQARTVVAQYTHAKKKYHLDQTVTGTMQVPMAVLVALVTDVQRNDEAVELRRRWNLPQISRETTASDETMRVPALLIIDLIEHLFPMWRRGAMRKRAESPAWKATHRRKGPRYLKPGVWIGAWHQKEDGTLAPGHGPRARTISGRTPSQPEMQHLPPRKKRPPVVVDYRDEALHGSGTGRPSPKRRPVLRDESPQPSGGKAMKHPCPEVHILSTRVHPRDFEP